MPKTCTKGLKVILFIFLNTIRLVLRTSRKLRPQESNGVRKEAFLREGIIPYLLAFKTEI